MGKETLTYCDITGETIEGAVQSTRTFVIDGLKRVVVKISFELAPEDHNTPSVPADISEESMEEVVGAIENVFDSENAFREKFGLNDLRQLPGTPPKMESQLPPGMRPQKMV